MNNNDMILHTGARPTLLAASIALALGLSTAVGATEKKEPSAQAKQAASMNQGKAAQRDYTDEEWRAMAASSLKVRVQSALAESRSLRGTDIKVESDADGTITLSGEVANERQEQRALRIARNTRGVRDVEDDIDVNQSLKIGKFEAVDDKDLAVQVAQAIAREFEGAEATDSWFFGHDVKGKAADGEEWRIEVLADDGEIELNGEMPTSADVQKALQAARQVAGVRAIDNDLDSEDRDRLRRAPLAYRYTWPGPHYTATLVTRDGHVEGDLVCRVDHGVGGATPVATRMEGTEIASAEMTEMKDAKTNAKAKAQRATRRAGVPAYSDEEWQALSDASLELRVESRLAASPSLRDADIVVASDGKGSVTLSGKVSSDGQRERAIRIADGVAGVENITENLTVDADRKTEAFDQIDDDRLAKTVATAIAEEFEGARVKDSWFFGYDVVSDKGPKSERWSIEVEADGGEIELNGEMPTLEAVRKALRAARGVPGVYNVENDLDSEEGRYLAVAPEPYRYGGREMIARGGDLYDTQHSAMGGKLVCQVASAATATEVKKQ